jgi:hypothetical protein
LARNNTNHNASIASIFNGDYLEAGVGFAHTFSTLVLTFTQPTAIMAVFLFIGSAFMLYLKAKQGPGPFLFATVLACLSIGQYCACRFWFHALNFGTDINITTGVLFPYDNFKVGSAGTLYC